MIPRDLYGQIVENMPIACIDFVLVHEGKVLLVFRKEEPAKEQWWIPGGRVFKGEKLIDCLKRKAREELGVEVEVVKALGSYEYFSPKAVFEEVTTGTHAVVSCFVVRPVNGVEVTLDSTSAEFRWIDSLEEGLDPYVKKVIEDSKVFEN
jgi:colanic acid biosynthesis protein WcaH